MTEQDGSGRLPDTAWLGPYQLLGLLGAGGMGAVYKARDSRLDRVVAIKVLPERFAEDPTRRERFEREARAVAALNHPHICQLYDVGEAAGAPATPPRRFLIMEYLEGQSLEDRIVAGPLTIAESLSIASDLADALDHAHRRGLVHRDLKPANVMLTRAGAGPPQAKLLDFGISRLQAPADLPALETVTEDRAPLTADGAVLGTYPYMAPEQLAGREADARSDLFAFGAVLYEMVTGQRAFQGSTAATLIGAILHSDPPPLASRQPLTPPALERVVSRCLAKDPDNRWQTARDLVLELKWIAEHPVSGDEHGKPATTPARRLAFRPAVLSALAVTAMIVAALVVFQRSEPADALGVHLMFQPPNGVTLADPRLGGPVTISPDGRRLAFVALGDDGRQQLWTRPIDSPNAVPLSGTEGASFPFWSPDSRHIGFFAQRKLKRVVASGGAPQTLFDAIQPRGGTWGPDGTILYAAELGYQLYRGSADGGIATEVPADGLNQERAWPSFLPDGRHFVYFGRPQDHGVFAGELDSTNTSLLLDDYVGAAYSPPGFLLALRGTTKSAKAMALLAHRFNPSTLQKSGDASLIAEPVLYAPGLGRGAFSVSQTGALLYFNIEWPARRLTWFDRGGRVVAPLGGSDAYFAPSISPNGKTVVAARVDPDSGAPDLWAIDVARGISPRLTFDPREDLFPVWSPDGSSIVFAAQSPGAPPNLFRKAIRETSPEEHLVKSKLNSQPNDWSADGRFVIYAQRDPKTQWDLFTLTMSPGAGRTETPYLRSPANEHLAQFSPDGTLVAYVSDESGTNEVYVDAFPRPGAREQVSTGGGSQPRWRGDGRELFYISPDGHMMSVALKAGAGFEPAAPARLFQTHIVDLHGAEHNGYIWNHAVSRDGLRFLISTTGEEPPEVPATTVLLNWFARLPRP